MATSSSVKKETKKTRAKVVHNTYINVDTLKDKEIKDYFQYLSSPKSIIWNNFMAGTARGLGFILGTVAVLTIVTFIVSQILSEIPWIGELFRWLDDWLQQNIDAYANGL
ncbi:hypothetical protein HN748_04920 [Candidatus Peregrinibacteria bacterium]|jgi:hypothetical protein|nr:hypothetical protein [Candidatus Peregrinibacteria bacterium]MBT7484387.1 hypothetical protein [Candidatus Peregrinibacteria bacterium]MBT7703551.1 hypothetical protein [Candidatus Peregrinibacteria bacterium]